jgi:hypothetical protein
LARVFFGLGSVRFFQFFTYKTEIKLTGFFKILIGFFYSLIFSIIFFNFLNLINFSVFFSLWQQVHPQQSLKIALPGARRRGERGGHQARYPSCYCPRDDPENPRACAFFIHTQDKIETTVH